MATEDNHEPTTASEVLVKLSSNGPKDLPWPERRIKLNRDNASVLIGRASKVRSKGFVASKTNGWFDSPVMSRTHAELVADLDKRSVIIRDIGSLHGTFINNEKVRIDGKDERSLKDGDTVRFGVAISRGKDSYAPTTVEVGLDFTDTVEVARNTFRVPDCTSDVDDSDSMSDVEHDPDVTIHTGLFLHQSSDHIDLTRDDEKPVDVAEAIVQVDGPATSPIIDLTSPPRAESPETSLPALEDDLSDDGHGDNLSLGAESELDDESIRLSESEDDAISDEDESVDINESESDSEDEEHEEYSSDDELISDDEHGLHVWQESDDELDATDGDLLLQTPVELPPLTYQAVYDTPLPPLNTPVLTSQVLPSIAATQIPTALALPSIVSPSAREPSPSDAAMMKSMAQPQTASKPTVATLKEKTGKYDYFEAREENKATLARQGITLSSPYITPPSAPPAPQTHNNTMQNVSSWSTPAVPLGSNVAGQPSQISRPVAKSPWHSTGDDFLNMPQEDLNIAQTQDEHQPTDEEEAMTSAYKYNLWKQARASLEDEAQSHRRIGINDIVMVQDNGEQREEVSDHNGTPGKRKAAAISTTTHEEEIWQSEQQKQNIITDTTLQPISPPASPPGPASQVLSESTPRPTKRMRRIAERVGFAALGGATVGAMIVTSLIYTAPSFA